MKKATINNPSLLYSNSRFSIRSQDSKVELIFLSILRLFLICVLMGMGGMIKGNTNTRKRAYGLMLVLAFGAALIGVMVIHRLRERRIFNLVLKEKDHHLISLQLLLQKEKDSTEDMKTRIEDLKSKLITLRTQKMELNGRVVEMQSTIGSIKDELRTMEYAIEERNNEVKMLRDRDFEARKEILHLADLRESLKQKDAEIEDLKQHRNVPDKVWPVSSDDPSNPPVNLTEPGILERKAGMDIGGSDNRSINLGVFVKASVDNSSTGIERREMTGETMQKPENTPDESSNPREDGVGIGEEKSSTNGTGLIREEAIEKIENLQVGEGQKPRVITRGGVKTEMRDNTRFGSGVRAKARHGNVSRTRVKKWKMIAENRRLESNGGTNMRGIKFFKSDVDRKIFNAEIDHFLAKDEKPDGGKVKNEDSVIQENMNNKNVENLENNAGQESMLEKTQGSELEGEAKDDFFRKSDSSLEDEDEFKEETDESEF